MGIDFGATLKSAANFMTPGVGAIHFDNGNPPIGAAPGIGTFKPAFEGGLAAKLSDSTGINLGAISADSYVDNGSGLAGLSGYGDKNKQIATGNLDTLQRIRDDKMK